jgi:hypothetical protein
MFGVVPDLAMSIVDASKQGDWKLASTRQGELSQIVLPCLWQVSTDGGVFGDSQCPRHRGQAVPDTNEAAGATAARTTAQ